MYAISVIAIFFAVYTIISKNPIFSVLFLIGLFTSVALYLIIIGLNFLGLSYILVYIGAISILFLFILMLINIRISELVTDNYNSIPLGFLTILLFNGTINNEIPASAAGISNISILNPISFTFRKDNYLSYVNMVDHSIMNFDKENIISKANIDSYTDNVFIANVKSKIWENALWESTHISSIGNILYSNLFILFIISSLILLLAMVGSIIITINKSSSNINKANYKGYINV